MPKCIQQTESNQKGDFLEVIKIVCKLQWFIGCSLELP